jgi:hypothetical protein
MMTHLQQPASLSLSLTSILLIGPPLFDVPLPVEYPCISRLYRRISRTISWNALSTLIRDLADVSMNLHPNDRAKASPSTVFERPLTAGPTQAGQLDRMWSSQKWRNLTLPRDFPLAL